MQSLPLPLTVSPHKASTITQRSYRLSTWMNCKLLYVIPQVNNFTNNGLFFSNNTNPQRYFSPCSCIVEASMFTTFASFPSLVFRKTSYFASRCSVMPPPHLICPDVHPSMHYKHFLHCYVSGLPHLSVFGFIAFPIEDCNLLTFSPSNFYSIYDSHCVFAFNGKCTSP